jgi:hypothetical protein
MISIPQLRDMKLFSQCHMAGKQEGSDFHHDLVWVF